MARAKATRRKAAALDVECAQPPAANAIGDAPMEKTPTMPDAQGLEEQRMDRHHDRDHGGLGDRRAGLHVQEKFVIVVKNHYIIVQVPVVWEAPYWPSEAPPQGDAGPTCPLQPFGGVAECEAKHSSGGLVLEVVLASLAEVAVKARAAADSACSAEPGYVLANEPVPEDSEGSGKEISAVVGTIDLCDAIKLDDGAVGAMQHDEGEQYDEDRVGPVVAKLAPYAVATVCLRGILGWRAMGVVVDAGLHPWSRVQEEVAENGQASRTACCGSCQRRYCLLARHWLGSVGFHPHRPSQQQRPHGFRRLHLLQVRRGRGGAHLDLRQQWLGGLVRPRRHCWQLVGHLKGQPLLLLQTVGNWSSPGRAAACCLMWSEATTWLQYLRAADAAVVSWQLGDFFWCRFFVGDDGVFFVQLLSLWRASHSRCIVSFARPVASPAAPADGVCLVRILELAWRLAATPESEA